MTNQNAQRLYLRRILSEGSSRLGVILADEAADSAVFGWRDRTIGAPVLRGGEKMWLRATGEHKDWTATEEWRGNQDAAHLTGIPKPILLNRAEWEEESVVNCAELMTFVPDPVCSPTPELHEPFSAPDAWWQQLRQALEMLASERTDRGTEDSRRYETDMRVFFGSRADRLKPGWSTELLDLHWSHLTTPRLWLLDWEHWGRAPAGYGAASLYCHSLLVPQTARKVHDVFADILDTPEGRYAQVCAIVHLLRRAMGGDYADLVLPLHDLADQILDGC